MNNITSPILVVEDSTEIRGLLEATLNFEGYTVIAARNGKEAIEKIGDQRPALIITDLLMPEMDGYTLLYRLGSNVETSAIPVIVISATYVTSEDENLALDLGAVRFMLKPIDIHEFLITVGEIISNPQTEATPILDDKAFYEGYRTLLTSKLQQKSSQLARNDRLLKNLSAPQQVSFQALLEDVRVNRDSIQQELEDINETLERLG